MSPSVALILADQLANEESIGLGENKTRCCCRSTAERNREYLGGYLLAASLKGRIQYQCLARREISRCEFSLAIVGTDRPWFELHQVIRIVLWEDTLLVAEMHGDDYSWPQLFP